MRCQCLCWCLISALVALSTPLDDGVTAEKLGPDHDSSPQAGEGCPREGCPAETADPSKLKDLAKDETEKANGETSELVEVPGSKPFLSSAFSAVCDTVWTAKEQITDTVRTTKEQLYEKSADWTSDIADNVREAVQDAIFGSLRSIFTSIGETSLSPGKLFSPAAG